MEEPSIKSRTKSYKVHLVKSEQSPSNIIQQESGWRNDRMRSQVQAVDRKNRCAWTKLGEEVRLVKGVPQCHTIRVLQVMQMIGLDTYTALLWPGHTLAVSRGRCWSESLWIDVDARDAGGKELFCKWLLCRSQDQTKGVDAWFELRGPITHCHVPWHLAAARCTAGKMEMFQKLKRKQSDTHWFWLHLLFFVATVLSRVVNRMCMRDLEESQDSCCCGQILHNRFGGLGMLAIVGFQTRGSALLPSFCLSLLGQE